MERGVAGNELRVLDPARAASENDDAPPLVVDGTATSLIVFSVPTASVNKPLRTFGTDKVQIFFVSS